MPDLNKSEKDAIALQELRSRDSFVNEVLLELDRIFRSRTFDRVQQTTLDFLYLVVTETLLGRSKQIKERTIGSFVYHDPDFDPLVTRKVSVAGKSLREKLTHYYGTEGQNDPIKITIPKGTFVPEFHDRRVSIEVSDFQTLPRQGEEGDLCQLMSAEITRNLNGTPWVRANRTQVPTVGAVGFSCWLTGCLDGSDGFVRLHISLGSLQGTICWRCFKARRYEAIKLAHQAALAIIHDLGPFVDINSAAPKPHRPRTAA